MATIYFDPNHPNLYPENGGGPLVSPTWRQGLPLADLTEQLGDTDNQRLVPFLGAGASLHRYTRDDIPAPRLRPTAEQVAKICADFEIHTPQAKCFIEIALQFGQLLDAVCKVPAELTAIDEQEAPSSWELANTLASDLMLKPFDHYGSKLQRLLRETQLPTDYTGIVKSVAKVLSLDQSIPQLLATASYYSPEERTKLIASLTSRLETVTKSTAIQRAIVQRAKRFVNSRNARPSDLDRSDYLIVTTNYDNLIEQQLEAAQVPFCVVNVRFDCNVVVSFSDKNQEFLGIDGDQYRKLTEKYSPSGSVVADKFWPEKKSHSIAMVYKIHGSLRIPKRDVDNVVIADSDYVKFIQRNGSSNLLIPAYVKTRFSKSRLIFLGYSFSDWNVRTLYEQVLEHRTYAAAKPGRASNSEDRDYVVMWWCERTDELFFKRWDKLSVLTTDLDAFAAKINSGN
jgi:hypothetical protein